MSSNKELIHSFQFGKFKEKWWLWTPRKKKKKKKNQPNSSLFRLISHPRALKRCDPRPWLGVWLALWVSPALTLAALHSSLSVLVPETLLSRLMNRNVCLFRVSAHRAWHWDLISPLTFHNRLRFTFSGREFSLYQLRRPQPHRWKSCFKHC